MPNDMLAFATAVASTALAPLTIYIFSRRSQLKALERTSAAQHLTGQAEIIEQLSTSLATALDRVTTLEGELRTQSESFTATIETSHTERRRIASELASVQTHLFVAQQQVIELTRQRTGLYRSRRSVPDDIG
jgi:chromosome segregation ATPase